MTQVADIAAKLFRVFKEAGMMTGALTAMAYVREAALAGRLTKTDVTRKGRRCSRHASACG